MTLPMAALVDGHMGGGEAVLFWVLAPLMILGALGLLLSRRAIYSAMCMVLVMICMAFIYVGQEAPFLGAAQVVVYTGAVMMMFLFVLMLVGVDAADTLRETIRGQRWIAAIFGLGLAAVLSGVVLTATYPTAVGNAAANGDSNPKAVARIIFSDFVFDLEIVGALLITAAVGAVVFTHRERLVKRLGQKERSIARVKEGTQVPPLPAPGVYARSNAADVPAVDYAGRPLDLSVPHVLRIRGQVRAPEDFEMPDAIDSSETPDEAAAEIEAGAVETDADPGGPPDPAPAAGDAETSEAAASDAAAEKGDAK